MRVLHYCKAFSPLSQTFIYSYVEELEKQSVSNHVLTHQRENAEERPFPEVTIADRPSRWHPRRLWHRALVPFGIGEARTSDWPQTRDRLESAIGDIAPDVIHAHFGQAGVLIGPVASELDIPLVVGFYGRDISALPQEPFWRDAYADLWPQADAVTVLSEDMKSKAQALGCPAAKLAVIHLSRDLDQFSFSSPEKPVETVLFVGRLTPKKAPLDAIRAVEKANEEGVGLHLELVGEGRLRSDVEKYVQEHDLEETVTIHGEVPSSEIPDHMQATDIFILPSKTPSNGDEEGTPTVLVEAQAIGLPCVSTVHAGIPEMVPEAHHDLLASEGDVGALAERLTRITSWSISSLRKRAERGRKKVEREFSLTSEVQELRKIYSTVIDGSVTQS